MMRILGIFLFISISVFLRPFSVSASPLKALLAQAESSEGDPKPSLIPGTRILTAQFSFAEGLNVRVGVRFPEKADSWKCDVLFLHGFGDSFANHEGIFAQWNKKGCRVISFDLPEHGGTNGEHSKIDEFDFHAISQLANAVEIALQQEQIPQQPLILAGYSLGGTIALSMIQNDWFNQKNRKPIAVELINPLLFPKLVKGDFSTFTAPALTRNEEPKYLNPILPNSITLSPNFAKEVASRTESVQTTGLPKEIPILLLLGDEKTDPFIHIDELEKWARTEDAKRSGSLLRIRKFDGAFHDLEHEPDGIAAEMVRESGAFASEVAMAYHIKCGSALPR